jgi:hypothetical protein
MASQSQNVLPKLLAKLEIASFKPLQGRKAILFGDGRCGCARLIQHRGPKEKAPGEAGAFVAK